MNTTLLITFFSPSLTPHCLQGELFDSSQMARLTSLDSCHTSLSPTLGSRLSLLNGTSFLLHGLFLLSGRPALLLCLKNLHQNLSKCCLTFPSLPSLPCSPGWAKSVHCPVPLLPSVSTILAHIPRGCDGLELCYLLLIAAIRHHKLNGLKHKLIILQLWKSEVYNGS